MDNSVLFRHLTSPRRTTSASSTSRRSSTQSAFCHHHIRFTIRGSVQTLEMHSYRSHQVRSTLLLIIAFFFSQKPLLGNRLIPVCPA